MNSEPNYAELLEDPQWKEFRQTIITRDQGKCRHCGSKQMLHVHHRQYHWSTKNDAFVEPWQYPGHLLVTLCSPCHMNGHKTYKVPTFKI